MRAIAMEPSPEVNTIFELLKDYWQWIAASGIFTAISATVGFLWKWREKVTRSVKAVAAWFVVAAKLPVMIADIQTQLRMRDGKGFSAWAESVDTRFIRVTQALALESSIRRTNMEDADQAIFEADAQGHFLWANTEFLRMSASRMDDVLGENWLNIVALSDRDKFANEWQKAIDRGRNFKGKFRMNVEDGEEYWLSYDATCNKDELGQVLGYLGYMKLVRDPRVHRGA